MADLLRAAGVELTPNRDFFDGRRRSKVQAELAGIRRAQRAAEAGMAAARDLLRRAEPNGGGLVVDGEPLTSERVKAAITPGVRRARVLPPTTASSRAARRRLSATTWAAARSRRARRS